MSATDALSLVIYRLMLLLGDCPTFQAVVGTGNANLITDTAFQAFVTAGNSDPSTNRAATQAAIFEFGAFGTARPRCILLYEADDYHRNAQKTWSGEGSLVAYFEFNTPAAVQGDANFKAAGYDFLNKLGAIRKEAMKLAGDPTKTAPDGVSYLNLVNFKLQAMGQGDPDENNAVDFWAAEFLVTWIGSISTT